MIINLWSHCFSKKSHVQSIKHDGIFINWFRCKVSANETHEGIQSYWWLQYVWLLICLSDCNRFQSIRNWLHLEYQNDTIDQVRKKHSFLIVTYFSSFRTIYFIRWMRKYMQREYCVMSIPFTILHYLQKELRRRML